MPSTQTIERPMIVEGRTVRTIEETLDFCLAAVAAAGVPPADIHMHLRSIARHRADPPGRSQGLRRLGVLCCPKCCPASSRPACLEGNAAAVRPPVVHEIKHDGYRLMVRREGARVCCYTKNGHDWADRFPPSSSRAPHQSVVVPARRRSGDPARRRHAGLQRAAQPSRNHEALLYAFDLLAHDGEDLRHVPLIERKQRLAGLLGRPSTPSSSSSIFITTARPCSSTPVEWDWRASCVSGSMRPIAAAVKGVAESKNPASEAVRREREGCSRARCSESLAACLRDRLAQTMTPWACDRRQGHRAGRTRRPASARCRARRALRLGRDRMEPADGAAAQTRLVADDRRRTGRELLFPRRLVPGLPPAQAGRSAQTRPASPDDALRLDPETELHQLPALATVRATRQADGIPVVESEQSLHAQARN